MAKAIKNKKMAKFGQSTDQVPTVIELENSLAHVALPKF